MLRTRRSELRGRQYAFVCAGDFEYDPNELRELTRQAGVDSTPSEIIADTRPGFLRRERKPCLLRLNGAADLKAFVKAGVTGPPVA
jgi:hypothetical protein